MILLPTGWKLIPLGEDSQYRKGKKPKNLATESVSNLLPYVDIKAFEKGVIEKYASKDEGVLAETTDTLMVWDGARSGLVGNGVKGIIGSTLMRILPHASERAYFHYFLKYQFEFINTNTKGTGIPHVDPAKLWSIDYPVAPKKEQIRIANKLGSLLAKVDASQARLEKIPTLLRRFRQSVLAVATSGELTREWKEENNITDWRPILLQDVANIIDPQPSHRTPSEVAEGIPYIGIGDLNTDGSINFERARKVSAEVLVEHKARYTLKNGDFIFGKIGTLGKPTILPANREYTLSANVILIQPINELVESSYLVYFLSSPETMSNVTNQATSTSQAAFGIKKMRAFACRIPPIEEQKEIVRRVESLFALADVVEKQYTEAKKRTDNLTQSLLAKAFRGELVPQDPNDESADILLKRIKALREQEMQKIPAKKKSAAKKKAVVVKAKTGNIDVIGNVPESSVEKGFSATAAGLAVRIKESFSDDIFTVEQLKEKVGAEYEDLKDGLFELLKGDVENNTKPILKMQWDNGYKLKVK